MVVGSSHRDVPKYVGEGVVFSGPPSNPGGPHPWIAAVLGNSVLMHFGCATSKVHHFFLNVMSPGDAVT